MGEQRTDRKISSGMGAMNKRKRCFFDVAGHKTVYNGNEVNEFINKNKIDKYLFGTNVRLASGRSRQASPKGA